MVTKHTILGLICVCTDACFNSYLCKMSITFLLLLVLREGALLDWWSSLNRLISTNEWDGVSRGGGGGVTVVVVVVAVVVNLSIRKGFHVVLISDSTGSASLFSSRYGPQMLPRSAGLHLWKIESRMNKNRIILWVLAGKLRTQINNNGSRPTV